MSMRAWLALGAATCVVVGGYTSASAQACVSSKTTTFVFGNGMFNSHCTAVASAAALRDLIEARSAAELGPEEAWAFELAYNESEPAVAQLFEVAKQRLTADRSSFARMLAGLEIAPDWFRETMLKIASDQVLEGFTGDEDLARHVARYRELVRDGSKVVLVAHSQGNLYANAAYSMLLEQGEPLDPPAFGIVGVATPADYVAGAGLYTTLEQDKVIEGVRAVFPSTLPANSSATGQAVEPLGHGFETAYLAAESSREQVADHVFEIE